LFAGAQPWQVIVAGSKEVVAKALRQADKYREELLKRGVLLVPLVWTGTNEAPFKKKGFGGSQKPATTPIPIGDEFETRAQEVASKGVVQSERRFKAEPVSPLEWQSWVQEQQASEKVTPGEDVYIVLRLDGRVRKSGRVSNFMSLEHAFNFSQKIGTMLPDGLLSWNIK
jgi:hypothetical protein